MNDIILQIDSLTKSFVRNTINLRGESEDERFNIIDNLNLIVPQGEITALIGGNGAGKTTLFNIISGFLPADAGDIIYRNNKHNINLKYLPSYKIAGSGIGRMFQDNHIFPGMSVLENMLLADSSSFGELPFLSIFKAKISNKIEQKRIDKARNIFIDLFGKDNPFWGKRNDTANSLSYGQQRLLGLARLFMGNYDLVLLDEPTSGVNLQIIKQAMAIVRRMVKERGVTVFLIEHNMKVVLELADFCNFMSHGKITAFGTPDDILGNDQVRKTYLGT